MAKKDLRERDSMLCRACENEERASEGYPCADCGTFICIICNFRGVTLCRTCAKKQPVMLTPSRVPKTDWPEH